MSNFMRFENWNLFSDMVDFCTFWTDCREISNHPETSLRYNKLDLMYIGRPNILIYEVSRLYHSVITLNFERKSAVVDTPLC